MRIRLLALTLLLAFLVMLSPVFTQDNDPYNVPEGMELIEIGQTKVIVPQGTQVEKKGGLVLLEDINSYTARKISDLETRLGSIEARLKGLEEKLDGLERKIEQPQEKTLTSD
ncbi:hypothetical protein ACFL5X_00735 [Candidatus Omnitrophota bacterium]